MAAGAHIALQVLLAAAKSAAPGSAEAIPIRVEFDAPAGCSSVDAFYAGVAARSERTRRAAVGEEAIRLGVRLTRAANKVHGELRVLEGRGDLETRRVEGVRCDEVVEVLSLTAALALDPAARMGPATPGASSSPTSGAGSSSAPTPPAAPPPASPAPPASPPPALEKQPAASPPPRPAPSIENRGESPDRSGGLRVGLAVHGVTALVLSPTVSVGGAVSLRIARTRPNGPSSSLALSAAYLASDPWSSTNEVVAHWTALAVTICPGWGVAGPHLEVDVCAQVLGGWLSVTDRAVTNPESAGRTWGSVGAMARLGIPLGAAISLELEAALGLPLVERRFITTTPEQTVATTPAVAAGLAIGIARNF